MSALLAEGSPVPMHTVLCATGMAGTSSSDARALETSCAARCCVRHVGMLVCKYALPHVHAVLSFLLAGGPLLPMMVPHSSCRCPACPGPNRSAALTSWVHEMSAFMRCLDPNHLVSWAGRDAWFAQQQCPTSWGACMQPCATDALLHCMLSEQHARRGNAAPLLPHAGWGGRRRLLWGEHFPGKGPPRLGKGPPPRCTGMRQ